MSWMAFIPVHANLQSWEDLAMALHAESLRRLARLVGRHDLAIPPPCFPGWESQ